MGRLANVLRTTFCLLLAAPTWLSAQERLLVFAGAASMPPTEELARVYQQKTGVSVDLVFGGSGYVLSQMRLAKRGDVYFPGSSDFLDLALRQGAVIPGSERVAAYLVPALIVAKGNPKGVQGLADLLRPEIRAALPDPERVCLGTYGVEILEHAWKVGERNAFRKKLATCPESCEKAATVISLGAVDAVIGWSVFQHWDPARLEAVPLLAAQIRRVGTLPLAVSAYSRQRAAAQRFVDFAAGPEGRAVFARHHYFTTPEEAFRYIGQAKPVGGIYPMQEPWRR